MNFGSAEWFSGFIPPPSSYIKGYQEPEKGETMNPLLIIALVTINRPVPRSKIRLKNWRQKGNLTATSLIASALKRQKDRKGSASMAGCLFSPLLGPSSGCIWTQ
jgi:hypothetical protein